MPTLPDPSAPRRRIRQVLPGLRLGNYAPGPKNSLTDVPGVLVHTRSLHEGQSVNTGVTTILARRDILTKACYAGVFSFNGAGELTGTHWITETGLLSSPIVLTNSLSIGDAYRGVYQHAIRHHADNPRGELDLMVLPVVGETYDGYLNDVSRMAVAPDHVVDAIEAASADAVPEGCTGGGTGMVCHMFKGGTGSSSRVVVGEVVGEVGEEGEGQGEGEGEGEGERKGERREYVVGALVQANYGAARDLRIAGVPVGQILKTASEAARPPVDGSIIVVVATDAPLLPVQLRRLAKRATVGLARVGGNGHNGSGDIFLAFSTANELPVERLDFDGRRGRAGRQVEMVKTWKDEHLSGLFQAAADAVEEAIYNALFMAETTVGFLGRRVEALPLERVKGIIERVTAAYGEC